MSSTSPSSPATAETDCSRDLLEEDVYITLHRTYQCLRRELEGFLQEFDLTPQQYNVLRVLRVQGREGAPCKTIRSHMIHDVPDVTRLVDRLVEQGWAARERSQEDRRVCLVKPTSEGLERCRAVDEAIVPFLQKRFSHISAEKLKQLEALLGDVQCEPGEGE